MPDYIRDCRPAKWGSTVILRSSNFEDCMSHLGHKRTLRLASPMSALPPKADIPQRRLDVRFVPIADIGAPAIRSPRRRGRAAKAGR